MSKLFTTSSNYQLQAASIVMQVVAVCVSNATTTWI